MVAVVPDTYDRWADRSDVVTTAQAVARFGRGHVRAQLAARRWQHPLRGVVVLHNGPLTPEQLTLSYLLACPGRSALAGLTAARWDGLEGFDDEAPTIVLPEGARRPSAAGVAFHWSTQLGESDVHPLRFPRRTRLPRSVIDGASWQDNERRARAIVLAAVQQRRVRPEDLRAVWSRRGDFRHRRLVSESILDAAGGVHSLPELDFESIRRRLRLRLPEPTRQSLRRRADGRYYLDVDWRSFDAPCEIHGIPHLRVPQWEADLERANEITIRGPRLLVFSSYAVRRQQARVGQQLVGLLRRGGWEG